MCMPFLSFIVPIFPWNVPLISLIFLKRSLVFPILLFSSISLHWSLRKVFLSLLAILWNSAFKWEYLSFSHLLLASLHFPAICKASSDSHFAFLHFFSMGMVLIPVSYTMSQISVHSPSGSLSIRSSPLKSISHCIFIRDLIQVIPECSSGYPYLLQFKSEFGNKEFMIWATVSPRYEALAIPAYLPVLCSGIESRLLTAIICLIIMMMIFAALFTFAYLTFPFFYWCFWDSSTSEVN